MSVTTALQASPSWARVAAMHHDAWRFMIAGEAQLMGGRRPGVEHLAQEGIQPGQVVRGDEGPQPPLSEARALDAEQSGAGEIGLQDRPLAIEGEVGQRREVIEFGVTGERGLGLRA